MPKSVQSEWVDVCAYMHLRKPALDTTDKYSHRNFDATPSSPFFTTRGILDAAFFTLLDSDNNTLRGLFSSSSVPLC